MNLFIIFFINFISNEIIYSTLQDGTNKCWFLIFNELKMDNKVTCTSMNSLKEEYHDLSLEEFIDLSMEDKTKASNKFVTAQGNVEAKRAEIVALDIQRKKIQSDQRELQNKINLLSNEQNLKQDKSNQNQIDELITQKDNFQKEKLEVKSTINEKRSELTKLVNSLNSLTFNAAAKKCLLEYLDTQSAILIYLNPTKSFSDNLCGINLLTKHYKEAIAHHIYHKNKADDKFSVKMFREFCQKNDLFDLDEEVTKKADLEAEFVNLEESTTLQKYDQNNFSLKISEAQIELIGEPYTNNQGLNGFPDFTNSKQAIQKYWSTFSNALKIPGSVYPVNKLSHLTKIPQVVAKLRVNLVV